MVFSVNNSVSERDLLIGVVGMVYISNGFCEGLWSDELREWFLKCQKTNWDVSSSGSRATVSKGRARLELF